MRQKLRSGLISAVVCVVSLVASAEFFSFLYLHYLVRLDWSPAYMGGASQPRRVGAWSVDTADWGPWHVPNATARQESACFSVGLRANSYGARDRERTREETGTKRIVVLGDSFAAGVGVDEERRLTNILEQRLGVEFLNFGVVTAGPLQYQMIYDHLATGFAHEQVVIMFLPANDFTDNDPAYWRKKGPQEYYQRHHRYYEKTEDGGYRAFNPVAGAVEKPAEPARGVNVRPPRNFLGRIEKTIRDNSWSHAAVGYVRAMLGAEFAYSGYFDYTPAQLDAVLWSFSGIRQRAGGRPVTIVVVPRLNDFVRRRQQGEPPLLPALRKFGAENGVTIIDLLEPMRRIESDSVKLYIPCDGHWTVAGNRVAAEALLAQTRFGVQPARE